jgi:hypothetical protein
MLVVARSGWVELFGNAVGSVRFGREVERVVKTDLSRTGIISERMNEWPERSPFEEGFVKSFSLSCANNQLTTIHNFCA